MSGQAPTPRREPPLDELWESLAADIHAHGYSVRDAIRVHRAAIESEAVRQALSELEEEVGGLPLYDERDRIAAMSGEVRIPRTMADAAEAFQRRVIELIHKKGAEK